VSCSEINVLQGFAKSELNNINFGLFISSIIPMVLIYIHAATWIVGLILISIFIVYIYQLTKIRMPQEGEEATEEEKRKIKRIIALTIVGVLGVVLSAYFLVESAVAIAGTIGIPQTIIGATIIAFGTSLPEITLDLKAFLRGHSGLALGDIIGSSFVNITLILGVTLFVPALLGSPITMNMSVFENLIVFSIITNLLFWYFLSREKIGWKEGVVFLFVYGLFLASTLGFV
jgi:cation:H+ antiporter